MICAVFIGMTIFSSTISDSFRILRKNNEVAYNANHNVLSFIWNKFGHWTEVIDILYPFSVYGKEFVLRNEKSK
jgi:hypothetical protein